MFNIRDSLPSVVTGNTFNIRWSVISFDKANYTVSREEPGDAVLAFAVVYECAVKQWRIHGAQHPVMYDMFFMCVGQFLY